MSGAGKLICPSLADGPNLRVAAARDTIYRRIMDHRWSPTLKAFAQYEGGDVLDAAVLLMPLVKFISPTDPKWLLNRPGCHAVFSLAAAPVGEPVW
jgi:GH15 family glucan-1,4-alpha-glucosidase